MEKNFNKYLKTNFIGRKLHSFQSLPSTNKKSKKIGNESPEGTIILSQEQTAGRGRLGRSWISPKGKGIWVSVILKPKFSSKNISNITLIGAAAVNLALEDMEINSGIKWPNDIVVEGKKVCGILSEASFSGSKLDYIVIGIGINTNLEEDDFPGELKNKATSLKEVTGCDIDRSKLLASVLNHFEKLYIPYKETGDISKIVEISRKESILIGKKVKILGSKAEKQARVLDIDDQGRLVVRYKDGSIENLAYGEVSVRGMDSYV